MILTRTYSSRTSTARADYDPDTQAWRIEAQVRAHPDPDGEVSPHDSLTVVYAHTDPSYFRGRHWRASDPTGSPFDIEEYPSLRAVAERAMEVASLRWGYAKERAMYANQMDYQGGNR